MKRILHVMVVPAIVVMFCAVALADPPPVGEGPIIKANGSLIGVATARINGAGRLLIKTKVDGGSPNGDFTVVANGVELGRHTNNKHGKGVANFNVADAESVLQGGSEIRLLFLSPSGFPSYSADVTVPR